LTGNWLPKSLLLEAYNNVGGYFCLVELLAVMGCLGVKYLVLMVAEFWAVVGLVVRPDGFSRDGLVMGVLVVLEEVWWVLGGVVASSSGAVILFVGYLFDGFFGGDSGEINCCSR
jgi:hypothetical protein